MRSLCLATAAVKSAHILLQAPQHTVERPTGQGSAFRSSQGRHQLQLFAGRDDQLTTSLRSPPAQIMAGYDTNLAAEFHALSVLYRLGAEATLTLGNKKSVDIVVVRSAGDTITVDVKGIAGTQPQLHLALLKHPNG